MNNFKKEEKRLKAFLKHKVSFDMQTLVKFLITGVVAISVTACGGGGGGSSDSAQQKPTVILDKDSTGNLITANEKYINQGNITLSNSSIGIIGTNSDIVNKGNISFGNISYLTTNDNSDISFETTVAKNTYEYLKEAGIKVGIIAEKGSALNEGNIKLEGSEVWGMLGIYSSITNNGKIEDLNSEDSVGIMNLGGDTINNGKIILNSDDGVGIYVLNSIGFTLGDNKLPIVIDSKTRAKVTNNGEITITGAKSQVGINGEGKNIDIINSETGKININNNYNNSNKHYFSAGIYIDYESDETNSTGNTTITNKGAINMVSNVTGDNDTLGNANIYNKGDKVTITNSGNISNNINLKDNSSIKTAYSFGIFTRGEETSINNTGNIDVKVIDNSVNKEDSKILVAGIVNLSEDKNTILNSGNITVTGSENESDNIFGGGIFSTIGNITNKGTISILGDNMFGIYGGKNSTITNEKDITANGSYSVGIKGDDANLVNNGNINIVSNNSSTPSNIILVPEITYETGSTIPEIVSGAQASIGIDGENSKIQNNGKITMKGDSSVGIYGYNSDIVTGENSEINLTGELLTGIYGAEDSTVLNNGVISINGSSVSLSPVQESNEKIFSLLSEGIKIERDEYVSGEVMLVNSSKGVINVSGSSIGIYAEKSKVKNEGVINLVKGEFKDNEISNIGMIIDTGEGINNGNILGGSNYSVGIYSFNNANITNDINGVINLTGESIEGMALNSGGLAINKGKIIIQGNDVNGISVNGGRGENYGIITIEGKDSVGMQADVGGTVINKEGGIINVGTGAIGMKASGEGSVAENYGTINIAADAVGGMRAWDGGTVTNYGTIVIDKNYQASEETDGMTKEQVAIFADGNSEIKNSGTIKTDGTVNIEIGGTYTVGTNADGTFGKLTADSINLSGNLLVSADIVKGSYEDSYDLDNMIEGKNIIFGEEYKSLSTSILYDIKTSKDENGNIDGELVRNNNSISNYIDNSFEKIGTLLDNYLSKENYEKLSNEDKELIDKVFDSTSSASEVKEAIEKLSGREYLNTSRQVLDIKESFKKYDDSVISTLDNYDSNFTLIGEYGNIQSKGIVVGYESKMTGFNGALKLSDTLYGTLGYGYSDINLDNGASGKIQTIHAGVYKDYSYNKTNIRLGVFGEYNFHDVSRENLFGKNSVDFNSYLVGVTGDISKKYGKAVYIQPKLALDISYLNVDDFNEGKNLRVKEQEYVSVLPKIELLVGKKMNNVELFAKSSYSYELGNLDKDMDIELLNTTVGIKNNSVDRGNLDLSIGTKLNYENISLGIELGKEFGKRDAEYVRGSLEYKF